MNELIERLVKATGPDREIDIAIAHACPTEGWRVEHDGTVSAWDGEGWYTMPTEVPHYTGSIDDALALLPPEWWGSIEWAGVAKANDRSWPVVKVGSGDKSFTTQAQTIPLTACIAALIARGGLTDLKGE